MSAGCVIAYGLFLIALGALLVVLNISPMITILGVLTITFGIAMQLITMVNESLKGRRRWK